MSKSLPSFVELTKMSWKLFVTKLKPFLFLGLIAALSSIVVAFVVGLVAAGGVAGKLIGAGLDGSLTTEQALPLIIDILPTLGIFFVIFVILMSLVGALFAAAQIFALVEYKGVGDVLSKSKAKVVSVFLAGLLVGLLSFGSFWLFMIPGLLVSFLCSFAIYELVLTDKGVVSAIKHSIAIIWHNFWPLLGRLVLMMLIVGIIGNIFSGEGREGLETISWILNTLTSWFFACYSYILYKHAESLTPQDIKVNLAWIIVPAIIGWLSISTLTFAGVKFAASRGIFDDFWGKVDQMIRDNEEIKLPDNLSNLE